MKSALNATLSEVLHYDIVSGASSKALIRTQYYTAGTFTDFPEDVSERNIELSTENEQYGVFSFMPPVQTMDFQLNNFGQKYNTENTASAYSAILKKNLIVKAWSGYEMTAAVSSATISDDFITSARLFHVQSTGGDLILDSTSYAGTIGTYAEPLYNSETYNDSNYAYSGFYEKKIVLNGARPAVDWLSITTNNPNISLKYQVGNFRDWVMVWTPWQTLASGANIVNIDGEKGDRVFRYLLRWNDVQWNSTDAVEDIKYHYSEYAQMFPQGVFVIDDPKFTDAFVQVSGRDYLKKALEQNVNLPRRQIIGVTDAINKVLDRCGIPYATHDAIATAVSFDSSACDWAQNKTGWQILSALMDAANAGTDDLRFIFREDGRAQVKRIQTDRESDWTLHYHYNTETQSVSTDSDKQLQRATIMQRQAFVSAEVTIGDFSGSTATAALHLAYATFAKYDSNENWIDGTSGTVASATSEGIFVRYIDNLNTIESETARYNTGIDFALTGASGGVYSYDITVLGCGFQKKTHRPYAEKGNSRNLAQKVGTTTSQVNPFIRDQSSLQAFADYLMEQYEEPAAVIESHLVSNPLLELSDNLTNINQWAFDSKIYTIFRLSESWNDPQLKQTISMRRRAFDITPIVYDRFEPIQRADDALNEINVLMYDNGMIWEQYLQPTATADNADISELYDEVI